MGGRIRQAYCDDYAALAEVMYEAVRYGPSHYSEAQKTAWVPSVRHGEGWRKRLDKQCVVVHEQAQQINGFMSLAVGGGGATGGYIDFAYIRPKSQKQGIFKLLYSEIESKAVEAGQNYLWVHASLMAQPAFAAMGFSIMKTEHVEVSGEQLKRFEMQKSLS